MNVTCNDAPYLIGRITAKVEGIIGADKLPQAFSALVAVNPLDKLTYWLNQAIKKSDDPEFADLVNRLGEIPANFVDARGQFWVGYYHQKSDIMRRQVGSRIAQLRKQKGLTQKDLAQMTGLKQNNISRIEQGNYNVGLDTLGKLSSALGVDLTLG